jgi:hypothetical protein
MKEKAERVKRHLQDNKTAYIAGGVCTVTAFGIGAVFGVKQIGNVELLTLKWHSPLIINQALVRRGHPGYRIRLHETGEEFASIRRLCDALQLNRIDVYRHLRGDIPDVKGFTFANLGEM